MKKQQKIHILIISLLFTIFSSCEEEIDVFTDRASVPVVYGLINLKDTIHYIKLYKNVSEASNSNEAYNITIDTGLYSVAINEYTNGVKNDSKILHAEIIDANENSLISTETIYTYNKNLTANAEYELIIENKKTGETTSSKIVPLGERNINYTINEQKRSLRYSDFFDIETFSFDVSYNDYRNENIYRFYYKDIYPSGEEKIRYFQYESVPGKYLVEDAEMYGNLNEIYFSFFGDTIPYIDSIERKVVGIDYYMEIPDNILDSYLKQYDRSMVNNINISSNIENGYGIFASKYYWAFYCMRFSNQALDSMAYCKYTQHLNFLNSTHYP